MAEDVLNAVVNGRYFWQLVFSYDNSGNTGEIKRTFSYSRKTSVNHKDFMSRQFSVSSGYTYNAKVSASVKYEGIAEGSASTEYTYHEDTALQLQNTSETDTSINEERTETSEYTIGAKSKLNLYQLCYSTDGVNLTTEIVATQPMADVIVKLKFSCHKTILGLDDILDRFAHTSPHSDNIQEWNSIRNSIVKNYSESELVQFKAFVLNLTSISPGEQNKTEWQAIRDTCNEIIRSWGIVEKQMLFKKLLERFSVTVPGSANKTEWESIRTLSNAILSGLRQTM